MPKYHYQAVDAQGSPVSGEVEADGPEEARRKLAEQGLEADRAELTEFLEPVAAEPRFSPEEAVEVASQVAELARSGLPLAPGLRAMADEMRPRALRFLMVLVRPAWVFMLPELARRRRVARALRQLADRIDAGTPLEAALESLGKRFPPHVAGLILAGIRTGRLAEALEEFVDLENSRLELRRRVRLTLAYPCVLIAAVLALLIFISATIIPQFANIYEEFDAELPLLTELVVRLGGPTTGIVIGVVALVVVALLAVLAGSPAVWTRRVLYWVPLVGPVARWAGLLRLSRLMAMLLRQQIPLPEALRLAAAGLREADLSAACRGAAEQVEAGRSLSECVSMFWQLPPSVGHLMQWGDRTSNPAAAFEAGTELFESRVRIRVALLRTVFPPLVFLLIIGAVGCLVLALFLPLISLIQNLT